MHIIYDVVLDGGGDGRLVRMIALVAEVIANGILAWRPGRLISETTDFGLLRKWIAQYIGVVRA